MQRVRGMRVDELPASGANSIIIAPSVRRYPARQQNGDIRERLTMLARPRHGGVSVRAEDDERAWSERGMRLGPKSGVSKRDHDVVGFRVRKLMRRYKGRFIEELRRQ